MNVYGKWLKRLDLHWTLFGDVQYRFVQHEMKGFRDNPTLFVEKNFNFINPKAGITYTKNGWQAYAVVLQANKEPNRNDFETGLAQQPVHESLHDVELGLQKKDAKNFFAATVYYMYYRNQLVLTGKINDVGAYSRVNVPKSYRLGLELQAEVPIMDWLSLSGNLTLSRNKIDAFTEYIDDFNTWTQKDLLHTNTDISFSPKVIANGIIAVHPIQRLEINAISKYVGDQYLDNTNNELRKLDAYFTQDFRISYSVNKFIFRESQIIFQLNNAFNNLYEPNGYTYPYYYDGELVNENYYYPMAGINFMVALNIKL